MECDHLHHNWDVFDISVQIAATQDPLITKGQLLRLFHTFQTLLLFLFQDKSGNKIAQWLNQRNDTG